MKENLPIILINGSPAAVPFLSHAEVPSGITGHRASLRWGECPVQRGLCSGQW